MGVLDRAVAYWKASDYGGSGPLLDGSGNGHHAQLGSDPGADTNDPLFSDHDGEQHLYLPGTDDNYASSPSTAFITGSVLSDWRVEVARDDWTPAADSGFAGTSTGSVHWRLNGGSGKIRLYCSAGSLDCTVANGIDDGEKYHIRTLFNGDDGAGNHTCTFYKRAATVPLESDVGWVQLGDQLVIEGTTSLSISGALTYGSVATTRYLQGKYYRCLIKKEGTIEVDADFTDETALVEPFATFTENSHNAATVTINRSATGRKAAVVERKKFLKGTDDYLKAADHADLNFADGVDFTLLTVFRRYDDPVAWTSYLAKTAGGARWLLSTHEDDYVYGELNDGVDNETTWAPTFTPTPGELVGVGLVTDNTSLKLYADGVLKNTNPDVSAINSMENAADLMIGLTANDYEFMGAAVFREIVNGEDLATAGDELLAGGTTVNLSPATATFAAPATGTQPGAVTKALQPAVGSFSAPATSTQPGTITAVLSPAVASFAAPAVTVTNVTCELAVFSNFSLTFPTFSSVSLSFPELTSVTVEF